MGVVSRCILVAFGTFSESTHVESGTFDKSFFSKKRLRMEGAWTWNCSFNLFRTARQTSVTFALEYCKLGLFDVHLSESYAACWKDEKNIGAYKLLELITNLKIMFLCESYCGKIEKKLKWVNLQWMVKDTIWVM